ncbi:phosphate/phosphite/phosphonate ABC transporter substrate-binding protein [Nonomuraea rubra]|uniref:Phosphonate transport system substrate-binding protein n=1 Tax=Nonomuraea rubra TaxID=46180 RepID=A0A7X0NRM0_9ACTN|nr:phosphate/phosphite/phosphonate ABC transporter substrate-binding protein [Nonomuraea rubra]MBB6548363.1 phosphonate transport system substrate-binding protein [Nonomuraea rubra]
MKRTLTALAMIGALAAAGCSSASGSSAGDGDVLRFAAVPTEQNIDPTAEYKDIIALIEKNTGRKVEFVRSTDYNAVIEGMVSGKIDLAEFGPLSYVLARSNGAKITPIASMVEKGGKPTYQSYGIVPAGSTITGIDGFKGAKVCFVDPGSTSGYLFPSQGLLSAGIDPKTGVRPVMAGGHDNSVLSVASGKCEAGFSESGMVDHILIGKGKLKAGDVKIVWRSEPIPMSPVAMRDDLPADLRTKLQQTYTEDANKDRMVQLGICASVDACAVTNDNSIWSWQAVTDATFDPVREVCAATKNEKCSKA